MFLKYLSFKINKQLSDGGLVNSIMRWEEKITAKGNNPIGSHS